MKYNYVVLGNAADYYTAAYADLDKRNDMMYIKNAMDSKNYFLKLLYRIHTSPTINRKVHLPFQKIWNRCIFVSKFTDNKPLCFVFFAGRSREIENGLPEYFRKKYSECKIVLYYQDMVKKSLLPNIEEIRDKFDIILSFDQNDAQKYNLKYYPLVYSKIFVPQETNIEPCDVFFVGKAKDRLDRIIKVYEKLKTAGLKCDFHIIGADQNQRKYSDEIIYQEQMPYLENLQRIKACKCMLEVMQQGGHGYTLRYCEAIMYNRKIITDNPEIHNAPFYNSDIIHIFNSPEDIQPKFIKNEPQEVDYHYKEKLSPILMLEFVDELLKGMEM